MKIPSVGIVLAAMVAQSFGQNLPTVTASDSVATEAFTVKERGANHRVWERTEYEITPDGEKRPHVHRYTELATGMHYKNAKGQWQESKEEIEILLGGGAAALQGQHQVYFPGDIYDGVIEIITPDGKHLKSRPLGISYFDGTNNVLIAELTNSIGQILPVGNQVVYTNCFTDFEADLVLTYRKSGFESDLVFRQAPPMPEDFGLEPKKVSVQLLSFFDVCSGYQP